MIRLFVENRELDLDSSVQVAITKQFEDLSNPTTIINDWSKTISIPFTSKNNEIFGHIYNIDRMIASGGTIGIYFDPYKKIDFRLQWEDDVLMIGYAKMNEIKQVNGKGTYEITLFGQLGKIFQEMKKITFDTSSSDSTYLIDGSQYVDEYLDRNLILNNWTSQGQTHIDLLSKDNPYYNVNDIIGFAPNNSFNEGFNYTTYQNNINESKTFETVLGDAFTAATGIEPSTAIPNGLLPREIGEYRSYLQLPYIYWNKLFQIFQKKAEEVTGYTFQLDDTWFSSSNPYWYNLVYMLYGFGSRSKEEDRKKNNYTIMVNGLTWGITPTDVVKTETIDMRYDYAVESYPVLIQEEGTTISTKFRLSDDYNVLLNNQIVFRMQIPAYIENSTRMDIHLNPNNAFEFSINCLNPSGTVIKTRKYLLCDEDYTGSTDDYFRVIRLTGDNRVATHLNGSYDVYDIYTDVYQSLDYRSFGEYATLSYSGRWINTNYPFRDSSNRDYVPTSSQYIQRFEPRTSYAFNVEVVLNPRRSNAHITLNSLWNNEYNLFDEILKYCKMYRIGIYVDEVSKKIVFKPMSRYFSSYTTIDWTSKVDKSKDFTITPITFEDKYVLFNYTDSGSKLNKEYKDKYGLNYGEYRLVTDYNFSTSTTNLFDKVKGSIVNTDNCLSWTNLCDNKTIVYSLPPEIYVYCKDKDKKYVDVFGQFYFFRGLADFSTEELLYMRSVEITDDTTLQTSTNTFFYSQGYSSTSCSTYPMLDILYGDNMCLFNIPKTNYTYLNNYEGKKTIYSNFWQKYIDERYNVQNKKITCYINLKPGDYNQFEFNKLVKLENQLCIVNKIYDYDITSSAPTKVDLITIQDITGYTTNNFTV